MSKESKKRHLIIRGFLKVLSGMLSIFSLPVVRNFIWDRATGKAKAKIIDVEAKVVADEEDKKKKGLFS